MNKIKNLLPTILFISGMCMLVSTAGVQGAPLIQSATPSGTDQVIWDAIRQEIASRPEAFLFEAYDWELSQVTYSADQTQAVVWLDPLDPLTGMTIATEPMVAIAELSPTGLISESSSWQVIFQGDSEWNAKASTVGGLLPNELAISVEEAPGAPEA
ncbi:MAG: hypothetical protein WCF08_09420, partial [Anaerolineaceae bacterium]